MSRSIGVIGCGCIWPSHRNALMEMPEVKIKGVFDLNEKRAQKAAEDTGAQVYSEGIKLIGDPEIEVVAILTPPFARLSYVEAASKNHKHLLMEKPMCRTLEEAKKIVRAVDKAGIKCCINFGRTVDSRWQKVIELTDKDGPLGKARVFYHCSIGGASDWADWFTDSTKSWGAFFDYGIHFIDFARAVLREEAKKVYYQGGKYVNDYGFDDLQTLLIEFSQGGYAEITSSYIVKKEWQYHSEMPKVIVIGEKGVIELGKELRWFTEGGSYSYQAPQDDFKLTQIQTYRNLFQSIDNNTKAVPSEIDGLRSMEIIEAGLQSQKERRPVEVIKNRI